ncbi:MAG: hypothetical protein KAJ19_15565 [Gammaproteobacteria bacterium]|nr:hypothetical protein [Gammaproteobacteria bacterium]
MTETQVKQYMENVLGDAAGKLGWSVGGDDFDEPTNEVLYTLEEADFSFATSQATVKKIRVTARMEVWRAAMYYTVHEIAHSSGAPGTGQSSRADIHRHCKAMYALARSQFIESYPEFSAQASQAVERYGVEYDGDYYGNAE